MFRILGTSALLLLCSLLPAQSDVVNDDCDGLIDLGLAPACNNTVYDNRGAGPSDIGFGNIPSCFADSTVTSDVWFSFTTSDTVFNYVINVTGSEQGANGIVQPQIAVYRGGCEENGLAQLLCGTAEEGSSDLTLNAIGLTPNITYFIRVDHAPSGQAGTFQLCVEELLPSNTIDQGGSTACSGRLFDSGGADGNYQNDEDYTFTICPDEPHECINFNLEYYNIDPSEGDQLIFYDGSTPSFTNIIAQFGGFELEPGGGVCFDIQSASDCITVRFRSNNAVTMEGFAGSWSCSLTPCKTDKPISVAGNISNDQIVDFISTPQTVVNITDINCNQNAYGTFLAGDSTNLGLERGLLLTTGDINIAPGPNTIVDAGFEHGTAGDKDLDYLSEIQGEGSLSGDACIVELDVFAATNELTFEYIFASEEYPEFVNTEFNDIFAFFISGPGIEGDPNIGNQQNIAVLPGTDTPVQINSVSHLENWQYFRNNELGRSLEYDGMIADFFGVKKSLTARAQVEPCQTYHLKLAIADRRDFAYDSGVFISELRGGAPSFRVAYQSGIDFLIEECTTVSDTLYVGLNSPLRDTVSYQLRIEGTATLGTDYTLDAPATITFLPGQTSIGFPISAITDGAVEGTETIELSLTNNFGCGEVTYTTITIDIQDELDVQIQATGDSILQCRDSTLQLIATGAADYFWTPAGIFENPEDAEQTFTPIGSGWITVEGQVGTFCRDRDSVFVSLLNVELDIEALDPTAICQGDSVRLEAVNNIGSSNLRWLPAASVSNDTTTVTIAKPEFSTDYVARVSAEGCVITDTIRIDVDQFAIPELRSDTTICQNTSLDLVVTPFDTSGLNVVYQWSPVAGLDDPGSPTPEARPAETTTYTLLAVSENGGCQDSRSVRIDVLPANVDILEADTTYLCLGDAVQLNAMTTTGSPENVVWTASDGSLLRSDVGQISVQPQRTTTYYTTFEVGICRVYDSVRVQVDSLPAELSITADVEKELYCQGETIVLSSPIYEPAIYPELTNRWLFGLGYETGDSLYNMVVTLQDTFYYQRITANNACIDTQAILIPVFPPPDLAILPADTTVCVGESVQLQAVYAGNGPLSWSAFPGLSCTDCPNPVVTPPLGTSSISLTVTEMDCESSVSASFTAIEPPNIQLNIQSSPGDTVFAGEPFTLTATADGMSFAEYEWLIGDDIQITNTGELSSIAPELGANEDFVTLPVSLTVMTEDGCFLSTGITLIIQKGRVQIPNAFTPNNDGINDVFRVYYNTPMITISQFTVYNRWGKTVFQSNDNQGWDGNYQGQPAPSDVYLYHIVFRLGSLGEEQVMRGDLTLVR
ncbi:choice-of-anchor L domain-containing protein [Flavilitoribacter nigricans]|uniref:Calx-beta domain-containing protein n=1 Tax=Flavilitoribacter nigricans (strain ATCC 23147 / DSM 23189 / NBRC 102662 / NCIMB 1420 / SS-2) TaxID=1122177 RepID=A0A2D0NCE0_FLAN2|nr:choice-of-anchor L domain-containing protein [Flavilitoribacter nigricans]PHN06040.1 hypothetical protein CRP01_13805 [Flavilitoribacter nigricans DSM 23189 = NBRC 102662]